MTELKLGGVLEAALYVDDLDLKDATYSTASARQCCYCFVPTKQSNRLQTLPCLCRPMARAARVISAFQPRVTKSMSGSND